VLKSGRPAALQTAQNLDDDDDDDHDDGPPDTQPPPEDDVHEEPGPDSLESPPTECTRRLQKQLSQVSVMTVGSSEDEGEAASTASKTRVEVDLGPSSSRVPWTQIIEAAALAHESSGGQPYELDVNKLPMLFRVKKTVDSPEVPAPAKPGDDASDHKDECEAGEDGRGTPTDHAGPHAAASDSKELDEPSPKGEDALPPRSSSSHADSSTMSPAFLKAAEEVAQQMRENPVAITAKTQHQLRMMKKEAEAEKRKNKGGQASSSGQKKAKTVASKAEDSKPAGSNAMEDEGVEPSGTEASTCWQKMDNLYGALIQSMPMAARPAAGSVKGVHSYTLVRPGSAGRCTVLSDT